MTPCRMCGEPATAVYAVDRGCVCRPDDREQALCEHHFAKAEPLGSMRVVGWLRPLTGAERAGFFEQARTALLGRGWAASPRDLSFLRSGPGRGWTRLVCAEEGLVVEHRPEGTSRWDACWGGLEEALESLGIPKEQAGGEPKEEA